jgi:uncharacterized membrane protein (DUF106 family)
MKSVQKSAQENLFGLTEIEALKRRIKELDQQISSALKKGDYTNAKNLTDRQAELLQKVLENGEEHL